MNLLLKKYHNLEHKQRQKINKIIIYFVIGLIIIVTIVTSSNSSLNNSTTASGNHDNPYMEDFNLEKEISIEVRLDIQGASKFLTLQR